MKYEIRQIDAWHDGVSGLEAVYEDELRGKDGVETITRSSDGVIVGTAMTTVPEPGHTVQLTIDSAFTGSCNGDFACGNIRGHIIVRDMCICVDSLHPDALPYA